ncbi:MAG: hypothetical protein KDB86_00960 [Actinobacteria bacterium]|nr:hypothetical protein [Actinomycetota bacterium]
MASWPQFKSFVQQNYRIARDDGDIFQMLFDTNDGRTQTVFVSNSGNDTTGDWVNIASPIGKVSDVNTLALATQSFNFVCGAIAVFNGVVFLKHSFPLADFDSGEFEIPVTLVTGNADRLEQAFTGGDSF